MKPQVNEAYRNWRPPVDYGAVTDRLLAAIPEKYLTGLSAVVLTNSAALSHDRKRSATRSRQRKVPVSRCLGLYHPRSSGQPAWVEIFIDRVASQMPGFAHAVPLLRELNLAQTLYHELGHHIHATQAPEHREREDVADDWRDRLSQEMFRNRHPVLRRVLFLFRPLLVRLKRLAKRRAAQYEAKAT